MAEKTLFEKIAAGEIPARVVWEDDEHIAFLDVNPWARGHTLVVPRRNLGDYIFSLKSAEYQELWQAAQTVAGLIKEKLDCERVWVVVMGEDVPHVHIHLLPVDGNFSLNPPRPSFADEELDSLHAELTS